MKVLFKSSFIMLVLALIITIPTLNSSFSQEEKGQGQKIQSSQSGTQNLTEKYEWPNIHENVNTDFNSNVSYPEIANIQFQVLKNPSG